MGGGGRDWLPQMRCGQNISGSSGSLLCSELWLPWHSSTTCHSAKIFPPPLPCFLAKEELQRALLWASQGKRHPRTPETHFLYRKQATGDCEGGRWQAETNNLLWHWPRLLLLALQLWGSEGATLITMAPIPICHAPEETEHSSPGQEPPFAHPHWPVPVSFSYLHFLEKT